MFIPLQAFISCYVTLPLDKPYDIASANEAFGVLTLLTFFFVSSASASCLSGAEGLLSFLLTALAERSRYLRVTPRVRQLSPLTLDLSVPFRSPHRSSPVPHSNECHIYERTNHMQSVFVEGSFLLGIKRKQRLGFYSHTV